MAKRRYIYNIVLLTLLGVYVFDIVQEGVEFTASENVKRANLRKRQLNDMMRERYLAVTKNTWPACVELRMSAEDCKDFIDNEIYTQFTEKDQYIRSIIIGKRQKTDKLYNAVVILMNDNDMVEGRDGDGMVYYDFTWDSSGELATDEQQSEIPPIYVAEPTAELTTIGMEPVTEPITEPAPAPSPTFDDTVALPTTTETTPTDDIVLEEAPLLLFDAEIEGVTGSTVDEFITSSSETTGDGTTGTTDTTAPIAGGVLTDGTAENTPEGDAKIEDALASDPLSGGGTVLEAGERTIEPIDCAGLTGESCCLLVKLKVRDSDINGNSIQCSLDYVQSSTKKQYWLNHRGKKVHIFSNHNNIVSKVPEIVGDWPKGIEGAEFEAWLLEAGAPPLILQ